jgi:hypothetical protein
LSSLLGVAVKPKTAATYGSAFGQLRHFCTTRGLQFLPVDSVTLCAWLTFKADQGVKTKSLSKYVSGVRHAHLLCLGLWPLSGDLLVPLTLRAAGARAPSSDRRQKAPLSLDTLLLICQSMRGWPDLAALDYDDLLWLTASVIAFFAALRGGEFFVRQGSDRPVLLWSMISVLRGEGAERFLRIDVPSPKTNQQLQSEPALAMDPGAHYALGPIRLWDAFNAARVLRFGLQPAHNLPAFQLSSGLPLSGDFMLGRGKSLCVSAGVQIFGSNANVVSIGSASWRAGYVLSAKHAKVPSATICANGRWRSLPGSAPYSFESTQSLGEAALSISSQMQQGGPSATFAGGRFLSDYVLQHGALPVPPSARP